MARVIFNYGHKCSCNSASKCRQTEPTTDEIRAACESLILTDKQLQEVMSTLEKALDNSLSGNQESSLCSYKWDFPELPKGNEKGTYLALDLGGRKFSVVKIKILDNKNLDLSSKQFSMPKSLLIGPGEELFNFVADCIFNFVKKEKLQDVHLQMGFTFIQFTQQVGIASAILKKSSSEFVCTGLLEKDVVKILQDAIDRRGDLKVTVAVFLNESLGALISCAWKFSNCRVGVYVGQICNACYLENRVQFDACDESNNYLTDKIFTDTQWATLGDDGSLENIRTKYDCYVDKHSLDPGKNLFEKMICIESLGELARVIISKLSNDDLLFYGDKAEIIKIRGRFPTKYISEIECDPFNSHDRCRKILEDFCIIPSDDDCTNVRYICECVSRRSAHLLMAGIAVLLNKLNEDNVCVGIDGHLYMYHPFYHYYIVEKLQQLVKPEIKASVALAKYGRGRGAALAAAVASRCANLTT